MTLGELLKQRRNELDLSQSELAEKMGIEQSYLSKLESDRSLPSEEIYAAWMASLGTDTDTLLRAIPRSTISGKLRKVPAVERWLRSQSQYSAKQRFTWVLSCALLIALAVPMFYLGYTKTVFSESFYSYQSPGIVLPGENPDIFENWRDTLAAQRGSGREFMEVLNAKQAEMTQRTDPKAMILPENRGRLFNEPLANLEGHSRTYYLSGRVTIERPVNAWLQGVGLFLLVFGVLGLILQRRFISDNESNS